MKRVSTYCTAMLSLVLLVSPQAFAAKDAEDSSSSWKAVKNISNELKSISPSWKDNGLYLWINELKDGSITIGEHFWLHAESESPGYITYLYYDSDGNGTLMYGGGATRSSNGRYRYTFPESGALPVDEPAGRSTIVAFLSESEPDLEALGFREDQNFLPLDDTLEKVQRISRVLGDNTQNRVAVKSTRYFVEQPGQTQESRTRKLLAVLVDPNATPLVDVTSPSSGGGSIDTRVTPEEIPTETLEDVSFSDYESLLEQSRLGGNTFDEHIYFKTASSVLSSEGEGQLDVWADVLEQLPESRKLVLIGHTDSRGSLEYNQRLSEQRAESARAYLVVKRGVNASRVKAWGVGEEQPVVPNDNSELRRLNRRVEFSVH